MNKQRVHQSKRGEIATILTIATFGLMIAGALIGSNLGKRTTTNSQAASPTYFCNRPCSVSNDRCGGGTKCIRRSEAYGGSSNQFTCWDSEICGDTDPNAKKKFGEACENNSDCGKDNGVQMTCKITRGSQAGTCALSNNDISGGDLVARAACKTQTGNESNWKRGACFDLFTSDGSCTDSTFSCECPDQGTTKRKWNAATNTCVNDSACPSNKVTFRGTVTKSGTAPAGAYLKVGACKFDGSAVVCNQGTYATALTQGGSYTLAVNETDAIEKEIGLIVYPDYYDASGNVISRMSPYQVAATRCSDVYTPTGSVEQRLDPGSSGSICLAKFKPTVKTTCNVESSNFNATVSSGGASSTKEVNGKLVMAGGKPASLAKFIVKMKKCLFDINGDIEVCVNPEQRQVSIDPATYNPDESFKPYTFGQVSLTSRDAVVIELQAQQVPTGTTVRILGCLKESVSAGSYTCVWENASVAPSPLEQNFQVVFPETSGEVVKTKTIKGKISWTGNIPVGKLFKLLYNCSVDADNGLTCSEQKWVTPDVKKNSVDYIIPAANVGGDDNRHEITLNGFNSGAFPEGTTVTAPGCAKQGRYSQDCLIENINNISGDVVQDFQVNFPAAGQCNFAAITQVTDVHGNALRPAFERPEQWKYSNNKGGTEAFRNNFRSSYKSEKILSASDDYVISDGQEGGVDYKRGDQLSWKLNYDPIQYKLLGNNIRVCDYDADPDKINGTNCVDHTNTSGNLLNTTTVTVDCGKKIIGGWWFEPLPPTPTPQLYGDLKIAVAGYSLGSKVAEKFGKCDLGAIQGALSAGGRKKGYMQWFRNQWGYRAEIENKETGEVFKSQSVKGSNIEFSKIPVGKYSVGLEGTNMEFVEPDDACTNDVVITAHLKYGSIGAMSVQSSGTTVTLPIVLVQDSGLSCDTRTTCSACKNPGAGEKAGQCGPAGMCCGGDAGSGEQSGGAGCWCTNENQCKAADGGKGDWKGDKGYCDQSDGKSGDGLCCVRAAKPSCEQRGLPAGCSDDAKSPPSGGAGGGQCTDKSGTPRQACGNLNKCNVDGGCDPACCSANTDCPTGQSCGIGNGGCKSGKSCGVSVPGSRSGTLPPPPTAQKCDNVGGTCTNLGASGCQAEGGSSYGPQDCGTSRSSVCCKFPEVKAECKNFGSVGGECKSASSCNNSTHTSVGRYGCSNASNICCVKRPVRETAPSPIAGGNTSQCSTAGGICVGRGICVSEGGDIVAPDSCRARGSEAVCCKFKGVTPPPAREEPVTGPNCPTTGTDRCGFEPVGGRTACKITSGAVAIQGYCCPDSTPDWDGSRCVTTRSGGSPLPHCPAIIGNRCKFPGTTAGGRVACFDGSDNTRIAAHCCMGSTPDWDGSKCVNLSVSPPPAGDLSCVPPQVLPILNAALENARSECNLIPNFNFDKFSYSCDLHKESGPDNDKYTCDVHTEGAVDWNPGACLDAIKAVEAIVALNIYDPACRAVVFATGVYKGCVADGAGAIASASNELSSALNNTVKNTVLWGDKDVRITDACKNPPAKVCSNGCLATEYSQRMSACLSTVQAVQEHIPAIWNAMRSAASSCGSRFSAFDAGIALDNNGKKTIVEVEVSVCDKNGVCEKRVKNVSIKPGQKGDIRQSITKVETTEGLDDNYTMSCSIKYDDGTTAACPSIETKNDTSVNMKLESGATGQITGQTSSTLDLADCDQDNRITTLDFTRTANAFGQKGANIKCDTDLNGQIDVLDLSNVIRHFDREVVTTPVETPVETTQ